ncbi:hypothetical protein GCM10009865_37080 [Aeromicrobium ponti]
MESDRYIRKVTDKLYEDETFRKKTISQPKKISILIKIERKRLFLGSNLPLDNLNSKKLQLEIALS